MHKHAICTLLLVGLFAPACRGADDAGWIGLFDGKTLKGWKANEKPEQWKVVDGAIVANGQRSHLFYVGDDEKNPASFDNFHFQAEIMTKPGSNSGVYIHTAFQAEGWPAVGYECQVNNSQADPVRTGSIYYVVKNYVPPAKDNEWFTMEIVVQGKNVVTKVDGKVIVDFTEPDGTLSGTRKLSKGTFALQAHDPGSTTMYRNIKVKKLAAK